MLPLPCGTVAAVQEGAGPRPFDVALRQLIEADPPGWLSWLGLPVDGPVRAIPSDVSTVLAEVDRVLRVEAPAPWLAHLELQASRDRALPTRLLQYHALLLHRHRLPVVTTVVLLRPEADGRELSVPFEQRGPMDEVTVRFTFRAVRVWERSADDLLTSGLGLLPLAPLAAVEPDRVVDVIRRMDDRLTREAPPGLADELWAATLLLLGLRYDADVARQLLQGVSRMRESSTYQAILQEGREEGREEGRAEGETQGQLREARRVILRIGERRLGPPPADAADLLGAIDDLAALEQLVDRALTASAWSELLADLRP